MVVDGSDAVTYLGSNPPLVCRPVSEHVCVPHYNEPAPELVLT